MEDFETSVETMEVAEPSSVEETTTTDTDEVSTETESTTSTESTESTEQSAEDNARYAAARRRAEAEFKAKQREQDELFAKRFKDYENPITHQPIRSQKDYLDALDAQEKLQRDAELQEKGINPSMFEEMVNRQVENNPMVLQAKAYIEATREAQLQQTIENDLKTIRKYDSNIKTLDDLMNLPNFESDILPLTHNGVSLAKAYQIANLDALLAQNSAATKQAAINNMKGTSHLNVTESVSAQNDEGVDIPTSELNAWKRAFPDCSMKELKKKYNNSL